VKCTIEEAALMFGMVMRYVPDGHDMVILARIAEDMELPIRDDGFMEELSDISNKIGDRFGWTRK
jgi:hypothetical protein